MTLENSSATSGDLNPAVQFQHAVLLTIPKLMIVCIQENIGWIDVQVSNVISMQVEVHQI
jgi:hypothetical protein